ncbi:MAG: flagellar filament capping protein FliD [Stellaceae bacterium]
MTGLTGVSSGILTSSEITSLIQQASAAYDAPITALQKAEQPISTKISALGQVQNSLSSLQSALASLADVQSLPQRTATSSSGDVAASVTNAAATGTYQIGNIHLASAETLLSSGFQSASGALGAGSLSIQVGSGAATTLTIASGEDNLADIASTINSAGLGVSANVVFDGTNYSLMLTGQDTGTTHAFSVSGSGGLAAFGYSTGVSGSQGLTAETTAQNASFSLNGLAITSGSNTISGTVAGLTLTLAASGSATVSVGQNTAPLVQAAQSVVSGMNTALATINQYASYSQTSGAGPLLGDVGLQIVRTDLLDAVSSFNGGFASGGLNSLGAVGFGISKTGQITLDTATLTTAAQSNYTAVAGLLGSIGIASNPNVAVSNLGAATSGSYAVNVASNSAGTITGTVGGQAASGSGGVMTVAGGALQGLSLDIANGATGDLGAVTVTSGLYGELSAILTGALDPTHGSVTQEVTNLNASVTSMNQQMGALAQEAQAETQQLTQQFSAAQSTISQLTTVSNFLSSYFNMTSG